ncbi:protein FAR1-RELATED SEQUENCE 5-like isoform X5 [Durio zibethinus]|uniref:Protein FAR1-RELATED SEQUENCE 5-like isoform X5 n=1 Tax=Durio zibethinus TaxID=66656 RepID=A0A6P5Y4J0_DURZI|nr:protein FAR1-RELATED SEQUENCE 5-like isoform X5 [Durio zibethinus]
MDLDEGAEAIESFTRVETVAVPFEGDSIAEPHEGMEFESEDAAKIFYDEYARRVGFVMRVMSCRRSERDGRILARRLGCNKEGHCVSIRGKFGPVRKPRPSTREGCKAMIHIKLDKSRKWVITRFVKDHNHPLVVAPREARQTMCRYNNAALSKSKLIPVERIKRGSGSRRCHGLKSLKMIWLLEIFRMICP